MRGWSECGFMPWCAHGCRLRALSWLPRVDVGVGVGLSGVVPRRGHCRGCAWLWLLMPPAKETVMMFMLLATRDVSHTVIG